MSTAGEPPIAGYRWNDSQPTCAHTYLWPALRRTLDRCSGGRPTRIFDLGCGNGATLALLAGLGHEVAGVDPSDEGVEAAKRASPTLRVDRRSASDPLAAEYGTYPIVISLEVVEHVYLPRVFARSLFELVEPGGYAIVSTPYHGYLKNLALALTGKMDAHFTALWDYGHIKFFSMRTLRQLLEEAGFRDITFQRVGRVPALAKSMIALARKPR